MDDNKIIVCVNHACVVRKSAVDSAALVPITGKNMATSSFRTNIRWEGLRFASTNCEIPTSKHSPRGKIFLLVQKYTLP